MLASILIICGASVFTACSSNYDKALAVKCVMVLDEFDIHPAKESEVK